MTAIELSKLTLFELLKRRHYGLDYLQLKGLIEKVCYDTVELLFCILLIITMTIFFPFYVLFRLLHEYKKNKKDAKKSLEELKKL